MTIHARYITHRGRYRLAAPMVYHEARPDEIRAALMLAGWTVKQLAGAIGVSETNVYGVINKCETSARIQTALMNAINGI